MEHIFNSYNDTMHRIGGALPVLCVPCDKRQHGGVVSGVVPGERIAAGTPLEYDMETRSAKFLRSWKVKSVTADTTTSVVVLYKTATSPELRPDMYIMKTPATLSGTGKADLAGAVTLDTNGDYVITVTNANIDALSAGDFVSQSAATAQGTGKALYCAPNTLSFQDTVGGNANTLVDLPRGHVYMYANTIPAMPAIVKEAVSNGAGGAWIAWELFHQD